MVCVFCILLQTISKVRRPHQDRKPDHASPVSRARPTVEITEHSQSASFWQYCRATSGFMIIMVPSFFWLAFFDARRNSAPWLLICQAEAQPSLPIYRLGSSAPVKFSPVNPLLAA